MFIIEIEFFGIEIEMLTIDNVDVVNPFLFSS